MAEIKKIQQGDRNLKWRKIIREIAQDDEVSDNGNEKVAKPKND